jgi:hypothetical protein
MVTDKMERCFKCGDLITEWFKDQNGNSIPKHASGRCDSQPSEKIYSHQDAEKQLLASTSSIVSILRIIRAGCLSRSNNPAGRFSLDDEPLTYPTICTECDKVVFAHSNGFRDFVLFDPPLGPPWKVHGCYLARNLKRVSPEEVFREGLLQESLDASCNMNGCNVITSVTPSKVNMVSTRSMPLTLAAILHGSTAASFVEVDYWRRTEIRAGKMVWVLKDSMERIQLIPWRLYRLEDAQDVLLGLSVGTIPFNHLLDSPAGTVTVISGTILGIERIESTIFRPREEALSDGTFSFRERTARLLGERPRLLWFFTEDRLLVPVIVKKWYSNQELGTKQRVNGKWERLGILGCLVAENLEW